jgi:hypothetical protein
MRRSRVICGCNVAPHVPADAVDRESLAEDHQGEQRTDARLMRIAALTASYG